MPNNVASPTGDKIEVLDLPDRLHETYLFNFACYGISRLSGFDFVHHCNHFIKAREVRYDLLVQIAVGIYPVYKE